MGRGARVVLMADTHLPKRAKDLPAPLWAAVDTADLVVHAGDWVESALLDQLESRSRSLLACWGNNDGADLRARLPDVARAVVEDVRVSVVHETGDDWITEASPLSVTGAVDAPTVLVDTSYAGLRLLNPGSPTDRRRQPHCTYMTARLFEGAVHDVSLHRLPLRQTVTG